jgi:hypothetical protein
LKVLPANCANLLDFADESNTTPPLLDPTFSYTLLSSTNFTGPYQPILNATSPYTNIPAMGRPFFGLGL